MLVPAIFLGYLDRSGAGRAVRSCLLEMLQKLDKRRYKGGRKLYLMVRSSASKTVIVSSSLMISRIGVPLLSETVLTNLGLTISPLSQFLEQVPSRTPSAKPKLQSGWPAKYQNLAHTLNSTSSARAPYSIKVQDSTCPGDFLRCGLPRTRIQATFSIRSLWTRTANPASRHRRPMPSVCHNSTACRLLKSCISFQ